MSNEEKAREGEVFGQELSLDELDAASGGAFGGDENCVETHGRFIYGGNGFPNCASTVEDGSWCDNNDACISNAVVYVDVKHRGGFAFGDDACSKAWH